jgi:hypothetical protein
VPKKNVRNKSAIKTQKNINLNTRGKNAAGQTQGQSEQDRRRRVGSFSGAGDPPRMVK